MNLLEECINEELVKLQKIFPVLKDLPPFTFEHFKKNLEELRKKF